jgi:hypothetical protein
VVEVVVAVVAVVAAAADVVAVEGAGDKRRNSK